MRVGELVSWKIGKEVGKLERIELEVCRFRKWLKRRFLHIDDSQIKKLAFPKHGVNRKVVDNRLINITGKFEPSSNVTFR